MTLAQRGKEVIMDTYARFPLVIERGEGCYVFDGAGKKYLDFGAGIAVSSLGHANRALSAAIAEQAARVIHTSNLYYTRPQVELAEKLVNNSSFDKVFFCNSGAESIEGSMKLARKFGCDTGRFEIIAMEHSFHGRTFGAVTATGQAKYNAKFAPLLPGVKHVPFNDFGALKAAVTPRTAAVLLEPIQGEGGIIPADEGYLRNVRELCDTRDLLLIFDEVQCGIGRVGRLFAHELYNVTPDVCAVAKGLGGGVPIGAVLCNKRADVFTPGDHASTFGGNPLAATAANVVLDELLGGLIEHAAEVGEYLRGKLVTLKGRGVADVRGKGLMLGIETNATASEIVGKCLENGLLLVSAGANVVRFVPPLIVTKNEVDEMIDILERSL